MTKNDYNWAVSIYFFGYLVMNCGPSLLVKPITPKRWIPTVLVAWGIISMAQAAAKNTTHLMVLRFLLGIFKSGYFPAIMFYFPYFYKPHEQAFRFGIFWLGTTIAGAFGGILAYFITQISDSITGWQALFLIEGGLAIIVGAASYFFFPNGPSKARFLTPEEKVVAEARVVTTAGSTAESRAQVSRTVKFADVVRALKDWKLAI